MKREDDISYKTHNEHYAHNASVELAKQTISENKLTFYDSAYARALKLFDHRDLHVDIGSGIGWLPYLTASQFVKVIAIEPSEIAIDIAKEATVDRQNIEFLNTDMIDAIQKIDLIKPTFFTTATVFSHIGDAYVKDFLLLLNKRAPLGSTFYFDEHYDTNVNHRLWRIRNKNWWSKALPDWQLTFFNMPYEPYRSGIYGVKVGRENVHETYAISKIEKITWYVHGPLNLLIKATNKIARMFGYEIPLLHFWQRNNQKIK